MKVRRRFIFVAFFLLVLAMGRESFIALTDAMNSPGTGADFRCYYSAAWMVRSHYSRELYAGIGANADPTEDVPSSDSVFAQVARAHGVADLFSYVYPPTLADLLIPFTFFSVSAAFKAWCVLNVLALAGAGIILTRTPGTGLKTDAVPVVIFLLLFTPSAVCLADGQVPILLLLLLVTAINADARGSVYTAGLFFALAAAIKLTPLIILIPFIAMREWKAARAIVLWCILIAGALLAINGWRGLDQYALYILPKMGGKFVDFLSRSLNTAIQVLLSRSNGDLAIPIGIRIGKILSVLVIGYAGWLTYARRENPLPTGARTETLALFLLLSCCVAPVAWLHAFVLAAPALAILAKRAWEGQSTIWEGTLLAFFVLLLSTTRFLHQIVLTPIVGIILVLLALHRLRGVPHSEEARGVLIPTLN